MKINTTHLILGNGVAGITAALKLREIDPAARISVISRETAYYFSRTALMYILMGQARLEDTEPFERNFYQKKQINLIQAEASHADWKNRKLFLKDGTQLDYDKLLIASGAQPVFHGWPGSELNGVRGFVSWQDLQDIDKMIDYTQKHHQAAVVTGAGLIGIELCEVFLHAGLQCHFLMRGDRFWPSFLNKQEAEFTEREMRAHGLQLHHHSQLKSIKGKQGYVDHVILDSGETINCNLLGIGTGVRPDLGFAKASDINCAKGILCDWQLRTNRNDVYCAGDCVEIMNPEGEKNFMRQIWYSARDMGLIAAENMAGAKKWYDPGPWYNSAKFFSKEYTVCGRMDNENKEEKEFLYQDDNHSVRILYNPKQVLGFSMIGSRWDHILLLEWINQQKNLDFFLSNYKKALFEAEFSPIKLHKEKIPQ